VLELHSLVFWLFDGSASFGMINHSYQKKATSSLKAELFLATTGKNTGSQRETVNSLEFF
jgi:hypothetical protein